MRVTIIPTDGYVSVDGEGFDKLDLSSISANVHAIQWFDTEGEVEIKDSKGRITQNQPIDSIAPYQAAIDAWRLAKDEAAKPTEEQLA
jgi:hypothetical protein